MGTMEWARLPMGLLEVGIGGLALLAYFLRNELHARRHNRRAREARERLRMQDHGQEVQGVLDRGDHSVDASRSSDSLER